MKAIRLLMKLCIFHLSRSHFVERESETNKKPVAKSREVEAFTTILLDDEAYSIQSAEKKLEKPLSRILSNEDDKMLKSKTLKNGPKGNRLNPYRIHGAKAKPGTSVSKNILHSKDDIHKNKNNQSKDKKKIGHRKSISNLTKKLQKRQFDLQNGTFWNRDQNNQAGYDYNQNYRSVSNPLAMNSTSVNPYSKVIENSPTASTSFYIVRVNKSDFGYDSNNPYESSWERNQDFTLNRPSREPETNPAKDLEPRVGFPPRMAPGNNQTDSGRGDSYGGNFHKQKIRVSNIRPAYVITTEKNPETTPKFFGKTFVQGNTLLRSAHVRPQQQKSEKDNLEEQLSSDGTESDGTQINFGGNCEQVINETCWVTREVGDVLTLTVDIQSSKDLSSFQVRWLKVYHMHGLKKGKPLEVKPDKLPWNMVSGSEGRELRLNPVTNTDIDPNCIVAKVFLLTKQGRKVLYTFMKRIIYRIEIPVIDMGKIYSGEELSINVENFMSLPERGNLILDWSLETRPHELQSLPSNIKISHSGRSVVLKELKKGRLGVLNCVVYSTSRFSVAKRRFSILKIDESIKRRSTPQHPGLDEPSPTGKNLRCRRVIRRSRKETMQRLKELTIPKSRKKRFKRSQTVTKILECEPIRKRMYSRWIRSLFVGSSTEDPRLMPLEKLFELSEEGDGTLDDVIPHEVHYVHSNARVVSGTSGERSVDRLSPPKNCTSDDDCGNNSICAKPRKDSESVVRRCYCRPNYYEDGSSCKAIPLSTHREKRLRRGTQKELAVPQHLFYEGHSATAARTAEEQEDVSTPPPKVLAFEEEESFLLSDCMDDKDCSSHASCVLPANGHPYCKCRPGFRGNGIFCWEIIDYVPPEETFPSEEEEMANYPNQNEDRLSSVTPMSNDLEEE